MSTSSEHAPASPWELSRFDQRYGKGLSKIKTLWIEPILVNP